MTHKANPKHLPPDKSAEEYEAEIAALKERVMLAKGHLIGARDDITIGDPRAARDGIVLSLEILRGNL